MNASEDRKLDGMPRDGSAQGTESQEHLDETTWPTFRGLKNDGSVGITVPFGPDRPGYWWWLRAGEMAGWCMDHLVNRRDAFGRYRSFQWRAQNPSMNKGYCDKTGVTIEKIEQHFRGYDVSHIGGFYATARDDPDGEGESLAFWSRWGAIDIDRHDDSVDRAVTLAYALKLHSFAISLGFDAILEDSNGAGGYHLIILFDGPVASDRVYAFLQWLLRNWETSGLGSKPETFPKQARLRGRYGNFLRTFGRHHSKFFWSRIWDGSDWLEGERAIDCILSKSGSPATLVPLEAAPPPPDTTPFDTQSWKPRYKRYKPSDQWSDGKLAEDALGWLGSMARDYDDWLAVGMTLYKLGAEGLAIWDSWSRGAGDKYSPDGCAQKWATFGDGGTDGLKLGSLFYWAKQAGWSFPPMVPYVEPGSATNQESKSRYADTSEFDDQGEAEEDQAEEECRAQADPGAGPKTGAPKYDPAALKAEILAVLDGTGGFALLYDAPDLLARLAWVEANDGDKFASICSEIRKRKGFLATEFKNALKKYRNRIAENIRRRREADSGPVVKNVKPMTEYRNQGCWIQMVTVDGEGKSILETIAMFSAVITDCIIEDDGTGETRSKLRIEAVAACNAEVTRTAEIPAKAFEKMDWVIPCFGPEFKMLAGRDYRNHLRVAIQEFSHEYRRKVVFTHTGWRMIDEEWAYLHGGGAIRAAGNDPSVSVQVDGGTKPFELPDPPTGVVRARAIKASLGIFRLAKDDRPGSKAVAASCFSATFRAPIDYVRFSLQWYGGSGTFKSSTAALAQQHFGATMRDEHFPANWTTDSPKSIANLAYLLAHVCMVVDDFIPRGSSKDIAEKHAAVQGFFQMVGDHKGRAVMNPDQTRQPDRPPMALPISTGEDRVKPGSADARTLPVAFTAEDEARGVLGTIDVKTLELCQKDADAGLYAASMAAYVQWLAPQLDAIRAARVARVVELRALLTRPADHRRTPDIIADLIFGAETFLRFAFESGTITKEESNRLFDLNWDGLAEAADEIRADRAEESTPPDLYIRMIAAALSSGKAFLGDKDSDDVPDGFEALAGWHQDWKYQGGDVGQTLVWTTWPNAERIGWTDGEYVYLQPDNAYSMVRKFADNQGDGFPTSKQTLHKMLLDAGKIRNTEDPLGKQGKNRAAGRTYIGAMKKQIRVLVMPCSLFWPEAEADPETTVALDAEEEVA
jgi:hypothetical protein